MAKGLEYRAIGPGMLIVPTPLYGNDALLSRIVLGEETDNWPSVRRMFERQGMPSPRATVGNLYYVPAVLKFLDRREGVTASDDAYPDDGPDNFGPR